MSIVNQPEEIIAITFTNKAANEIKQRVLNALSNAKRKIIPEKKHEILTAEFAASALKRSEAKKMEFITVKPKNQSYDIGFIVL
ncbi:MAG: UvrD-helicase domain-containing protein [Woeseiaceae bacterium]